MDDGVFAKIVDAEEFAPGFAGLAIVGLFAAAMSSIDSALNSLSASTVEDYIGRFTNMSERRLFLSSKLATLGGGLFAVAFSFQVERIAPTVLEAINKIGSMANGPLLALFGIALFLPGAGQAVALTGFGLGLLVNVWLWLEMPGLSWLWWNVTGLLAGILPAIMVVALRSGRSPARRPDFSPVPRGIVASLLAMTTLILAVALMLGLHS